MELRDKLPKESGAQPLVMSTANSTREEAISALCSLGYKPLEASRMISAVEEPEEKSCEMLIRQALQGSVR